MDLISVIVPVYKVEKYLDRCVQSIVDQTYRNLEIILVDDGSPDNCGSLCDAWAAKDSRIKVIHKENGGLSDARNAGMAIATGEYIAFVDSDDWIHPDYTQRLYESIERHGAQISACDFLMTGERTAFAELDAVESTCHTAAQALEMLTNNRGYRAVAWNKLYSRSILEGEQYPVGRYHEDEFFTYRIIDKAQRLAYVDVPLYYYFQRPGSIMNSVSIRHLDALDAYLERLELFRQKYPELYREGKVKFCNACINNYAEALMAKPDDFKEYDKRIRAYRKQIRITFAEFLPLPLGRKVYVLGSRVPRLFCSVLNFVRERRNG